MTSANHDIHSEDIIYRDDHILPQDELQALFLSLDWSSGHYPEKLSRALTNYGKVITAWHDDRLVGLVGAIDDKVMTAYVHYVLVHPDYQGFGIGIRLMEMLKKHYSDYLRIVLCAYDSAKPFYSRLGFKAIANETPMCFTEMYD